MEKEIVKIGNTTFSKPSLIGLTKEAFFKQYKGIINVDLLDAWKMIAPYTKKKKK